MGFLAALLTFSAAILNLIPVGAKTPEASTIIRPAVAYGELDTSADKLKSRAYTLQLMRDSGHNQRYGFEYSNLRDIDETIGAVDSFGIVLEQVLPRGFLVSLSAVSNVDYKAHEDQVFGLVTNIGWEYGGKSSYRPYVGYRNNTIFTADEDVFQGINIGMSVSF